MDNRQTIIDVATQLITEKGIENTSLADIAREAGISRGTLYYYYTSKSDLIFDVAEQHVDQVTNYLTRWVDQSAQTYKPEDLLRNVLDTVLQAELRGKLHLYLVQQAVTNDPALRERFKVKYASWKEMIEKRLAIILDSDQDQTALAAILIAVLDGLIMQSLLDVGEIDLEAVAHCLAENR